MAGWKGSRPDTSTGQLAPTLANKIGEIYPAIIYHHNNKMLPLPSRADSLKVPEKDRVDWDSSKDRGAYIKKYIDIYGNPKWDWSAIDIHHVIPRERGGNNSFYNRYIVSQGANFWKWNLYTAENYYRTNRRNLEKNRPGKHY